VAVLPNMSASSLGAMASPPRTPKSVKTPITALARRSGRAACSSSGQLYYLNSAPRYQYPGSPRDAKGATMAWMWSEDPQPPQPAPHLLEPPAPRTRSPLSSPTSMRGALCLATSASDSALTASLSQRQAMQWQTQYASLPSSGFRLRNTASNQFDSRHSKGLQFRQYLEEVRSQTDANHLGKKGVEGFRAFLKKQYGSYLAAWRALDYERRGALSFGEFCRACRTIGFHGNLKQVWKELDAQGRGAVTLTELEPRTGHIVGHFQSECISQYGSMHRAWAEIIDLDKNGWVAEGEIVRAVGTLGLAEYIDGRELYRLLCTGPPKAGLRLHDFDPDGAREARKAVRRPATGLGRGLCIRLCH